MKTTKTILFSLTIVTGTLAPYTLAQADNHSQWECVPSKDFRSWSCLKDGQAPVEPEPEPIAEIDAPKSEGVTVTPLAEPEPIQPVGEVEPQVAEEPAPQPVEQPRMADTPPQVEPAVEPPPVVEEKADEIVKEEPVVETPEAADTPEPAPLADTQQSPEPIQQQPVEEISTATETQPEPVPEETPVQAVAVEATMPAQPATSDLVRIDNSLPSCVVINRPVVIPADEREQLRQSSATEIEADEATLEKDTLTTLSGNVRIKRADQTVTADQVVLNKETNEADATGAVSYTDSEIELKADQAHMNLDADQNRFDNTTFTLLENYARGSASQVRTEKGTKVTLDNTQYTSCPPGNNTWLLSADEIVLDDVTGRGTAKNAKLEFFDVPVFYAPYINFPIDDRRQSGLLTPRIGRSDGRGTELTLPIYWNIAPDRDATFYPRYMSKRGLQLGGEFRYLGDQSLSQVNLEYLNSDDEYNDKDRWAFNFQHDATIFNDWSLDAQVQRVSDDYYFEDLGSSLALSSRRHLESKLEVGKHSDNWAFTGLLQDYQTIDRNLAVGLIPYERMPHLSFDAWTNTFGGGFKAGVETEYTRFDHEKAAMPTGKRLAIYPSISYRHETAGYYIEPKFGVHRTKYSLDRLAGFTSSSPSRTVPIFSIDSGLLYERNTDLFGKSVLQTLEPRIYYLRAAEKNQADIPIFDTDIYDYNSSSLFRENRYSGLDRIGDANQLSIGITSRFLDPVTGAEKLSLTFGQIYYFKDRDITLPTEVMDDDDVSPIIAEVKYRPYESLAASALVHWDPEHSKTERTIYRLKYQPDDHRIVNLSYRFREDSIKQTDVSFLWPITDDNRWHAVGRWNHSLRHSKTLDVLGGIEYESCCWKTRFVARRWLNDINGDHDTGVFFEIELKGLGSIGDDITNFLETGILGYDRHIKDEDDDTYYY